VDELWVESVDDVPGLYAGNPGVVAAYRVTERVVRECQPTWPAGERSPWLKRILFMNRSAAMSPEVFDRHWEHVHGPLALQHHVSARYVQNLITGMLAPGSPRWDGIVLLSYWDAAHFVNNHFAHPESKEMIAADMRKFTSPGVEVRLLSEYILRV